MLKFLYLRAAFNIFLQSKVKVHLRGSILQRLLKLTTKNKLILKNTSV